MDTVKHVTEAEFETEAIRAQMRSMIRVGVKHIYNGRDSYKGTVRVVEPDTDWTDDAGRTGNNRRVQARQDSAPRSARD